MSKVSSSYQNRCNNFFANEGVVLHEHSEPVGVIHLTVRHFSHLVWEAVVEELRPHGTTQVNNILSFGTFSQVGYDPRKTALAPTLDK